MSTKSRLGLRIAIQATDGAHTATPAATAADSAASVSSFKADATDFSRGDLAVSASGVTTYQHSALCTTLDPDSLRLEEILGRGASSYVQAATHIPTGTRLALKTISYYDKSKRDQILAELTALFAVQCPTIIRFHGAFHREGSICVALEHMDLGDLSVVCARFGPLPERALAAVAFQMLWALSYLRRERRLMRDIKPGNVLFHSDGSVRLSDFGVSSELANSIGMASTFVGSCRYMAPERISHLPYGFASDVWSTGLVLCEAATGRYPYPVDASTSYIELAETIVCEPEPALGADFSPGLRQFVAACLKKNAGDRLPSDILLGSPWLSTMGVRDLETARAACREWFAASAAGRGARGGAREGAGGGVPLQAASPAAVPAQQQSRPGHVRTSLSSLTSAAHETMRGWDDDRDEQLAGATPVHRAAAGLTGTVVMAVSPLAAANWAAGARKAAVRSDSREAPSSGTPQGAAAAAPAEELI